MSKKEKTAVTFVENFQTVATLVPKLEAVIKVLNEIATGYQKYRKNGGAAIPDIEKHLGIKEQNSVPSKKTKKPAKTTKSKVPKEAKAPKETIEIPAVKKTKKKAKK